MDDTSNFAEHLHTAEDDLMAARFTDEQARAITEAVCKLNSGLASKADLGILRSDLGNKIESVRSDLGNKIERSAESLSSELMAKIEQSAKKTMLQCWGLNVGLVAVVVAVVKLVPGLG